MINLSLVKRILITLRERNRETPTYVLRNILGKNKYTARKIREECYYLQGLGLIQINRRWSICNSISWELTELGKTIELNP